MVIRWEVVLKQPKQASTSLLPTVIWFSDVIWLDDYPYQSSVFEICYQGHGEESLSPAEQRSHRLIESMDLLHQSRDFRNSDDSLKSRFEETMEQFSDQRCRTMLIIRCYYAWFLLQTGCHYKCLDIVLYDISIAEKTMGLEHLLVLKHLRIAAQAYIEQGAYGLAHNYIRMISCRLRGLPGCVREQLRF